MPQIRTCAAEPAQVSPAHLPLRITLVPPQNLTTMDGSASSSSSAAAPAIEEPPKEDPQTVARWYQLEALEWAKRGNTVAFLETGAGKTLIAVLLLHAYAHRVRRPARDFAVFLVPTVVLVAHTDLRLGADEMLFLLC